MRSPNPLMVALQNPFELYTLPTPLCDLFSTYCYKLTFPRIFFLQLRESVCIHFTKITKVIAYFNDRSPFFLRENDALPLWGFPPI